MQAFGGPRGVAQRAAMAPDPGGSGSGPTANTVRRMSPAAAPRPHGLLVLHGNRLESLAQVLLAWLARNPLAPLEEETLLVPSNGMAEWLKMAMAESLGVSAAVRIELPARFVWRLGRSCLGRDAVPTLLPLDEQPLTWRLMSLLPGFVGEGGPGEVVRPLRDLLGDGSPAPRLALSQRVADLFDQYQVYRADWLDDWAAGLDRLRPMPGSPASQAVPLPADQRWQPALWRAVLAALPPHARECTRAALQRRLLQVLRERPDPDAGAPRPAGLPRRVVLFGTTQLPLQVLEVLEALSAHAQVILAVPNPCRYHWADIIDGREQLAFERRRHPLRAGRALDVQPLSSMHAFGHPLLAAWGRQARDFVRQLDAFDDVQRSRQAFDLPRIDCFDDDPAPTLLRQVQAAIRDLLPLGEHAFGRPPAADRSIVFHVAHGPQREVEVLHDQLLHLLAHPPPGGTLQPRDIVVMVPDIEVFAPSIRAVFGQHPPGDARHIPWGIADLRDRGRLPLLRALEWLLRADAHRFTVSECRDLLELPAFAQRLGLAADALPQALAWIEAAGIRWGLDAAHREALGLGACGEVATWRFGLRRMLLGYAAGELPDGFAGIEPLTRVAGTAAPVAGALAEMVQLLAGWWADARVPRTPSQWVQRLRQLLTAAFEPQDDDERAQLAAAGEALSQWLRTCEAAGFDEAVGLDVLREAWLGHLQPAGQAARFKAGGVTFCTLLPMRAIPFEVVCLLGMDEGAYPRGGAAGDDDLMRLPGLARPGDRSRRDDDRQLMLDALLSARRTLLVSWAGRSPRDNSEQPPSVLAAQLRDYLDQGWGRGVCDERTTHHPLQPFSRRYHESPPDAAGAGLFTYAREWRQAHGDAPGAPLDVPVAVPATPEPLPPRTLSLDALGSFLRNPVRAYFRHRLGVVFDDETGPAAPDEEVFAADSLLRSRWLERLLQDGPARTTAQRLQQLWREGALPLGAPGRAEAAALQALTDSMLAAAGPARQRHTQAVEALRVALPAADGVPCCLDDVLDDLWAAPDGGPCLGLTWVTSPLGSRQAPPGPSTVRADKLLVPWLRALACAAAGLPAGWLVIGPDAVARLPPVPAEAARHTLQRLLAEAGRRLADRRAPATAARTALCWLADPARARSVYDGQAGRTPGERVEPCLARLYPSFDALAADPHFETDSAALYAACRRGLHEDWTFEALAGAVSPGALPGEGEGGDD